LKVTNPIPSQRVADYVERILIIDDYSMNFPFALPLFANGTPTLLFLSAKASIQGKSTSYLTLFGQTVFPETLTIEDSFILIAYFFKPFTLYPLFGVAAKELTDFPIDLGLLHAGKADELKERLLNADGIAEMVNILDDYIFSLITRIKTETQLLQFATSFIAKDPSKDTLLSVQKQLYITERTFQRLFEKNIGVAPSLFRRICQFNAAFQQINNRNFKNLTHVALENGYFDQSHFIRAFKEFTRITPKEYLRFGEPEK